LGRSGCRGLHGEVVSQVHLPEAEAGKNAS